MSRVPFNPCGAFFLVYWLFMNRFGHNTHNIEAEYLRNRTVQFILLLIKDLKLKVVNNRPIDILIFSSISFNVINSFNIINKPSKFGVVIFDTVMKETVSRIIYLHPRSYFMAFKK